MCSKLNHMTVWAKIWHNVTCDILVYNVVEDNLLLQPEPARIGNVNHIYMGKLSACNNNLEIWIHSMLHISVVGMQYLIDY